MTDVKRKMTVDKKRKNKFITDKFGKSGRKGGQARSEESELSEADIRTLEDTSMTEDDS